MRYEVLNETVVNLSEFRSCLSDAATFDAQLVLELDRLYVEWKEEGDFYFFLEEESEADMEKLRTSTDEVEFFKLLLGKESRGMALLIGREERRRSEEIEKKHREEEQERLAREKREGEKNMSGRTKTITLPGGAEMEMIYCAPGSFMMGSPKDEEGRDDDGTQHKVTLTRGFWLGKYPVTQAQWESVMGDNPSYFEGDANPVDYVSWDDCKEFIKKINSRFNFTARFPTEAEWEYACRAGTTTMYHWGNALNGDRANCDGNFPCGTSVEGRYLQKTTPVGSYDANPWGFYDMHGNVLEWCADWYGSYLTKAVTDPEGPASGVGRVLRGGSWFNIASSCCSAYRYSRDPDDRISLCGFRLCCSAGPHE